MSDISNSFQATTLSIRNFFDPANIGYYIPIYQRKYSWDVGNVNQLMLDICYGVGSLLTNLDTSHFLGTLILVDTTPNRLKHAPISSITPKSVRKVIDGQQRISTLALLACQLYRRLHLIKQNFPRESDFSELFVAISNWQGSLENIFSFDLFRGLPTRKPIIIREECDYWIEVDTGQSTYKSEVSNYIAQYIFAINANRANPDFPSIPTTEPLGPNLEAIEDWLDKVTNAHKSDNEDEFPPAWEILKGIPQGKLWQYERPRIANIIYNRSTPIEPLEEQLCSIVQLLAFCYYLLNGCGFTVILPQTEDRAFDMFQSLNATGTPLTAIETFKPLVTNAAEALPNGYHGSKLEEYFCNVDDLFSNTSSAAAKNTLTNEYITAFALIQNGTKLPSQFSKQRMWLTQSFSTCRAISEKEEFVHRMSDLAIYWKDVLRYNPARYTVIPRTEKIQNINDAKEAALCILYLKDAGHTMANTLLGRFYGQFLRNKPNADENFVSACKAIAAFFTLWRSALPNKDLDDVYRKLLANEMSWEQGDKNITISNLKKQLLKALEKKGIGTEQEWSLKAHQDLRYDIVKTVCKFALFVAAHDTEPDQEPGLMRIAVSKTNPHLLPDYWKAPDFRSIEHIAPQNRNPNSDWDPNIYLNGDQQRIGNLILLPTEINSTVGNKPWQEKWYYYQFLAQTDPKEQENIKEDAAKNGIALSQSKALKLLVEAGHQDHIKSVVSIGKSGDWNSKIIEKRTKRICEILWKRMMSWLE